MKRPLKVLILTLVVLIALPLVAWTATFVYWQVTIQRSLRGLEARAEGRAFWREEDENFETLRGSGCRALPLLVRAMEDPAGGEFHWAVLDHLLKWEHKPLDPDTYERWSGDLSLVEANRIRFWDPPDERRAKVRKIGEWWDAEGHRYHQWWAVWSSNCRGTRTSSDP